ncbi:MAG: HepT-like ribonuclease domain-containing protein [Methylocystis sp.]
MPWREIAAIGNILRHEYKRVDIVILWDVCTVHLEPLSVAVQKLMRMRRQARTSFSPTAVAVVQGELRRARRLRLTTPGRPPGRGA